MTTGEAGQEAGPRASGQEAGARTVLFDPFSGISGDMVLGAWIDLGLDPQWIAEVAEAVGVHLGDLRAEREDRAGLSAIRVTFRVGAGEGVASNEADAAGHGHPHGIERGHARDHRRGHAAGRRFADIRRQIEDAPLPDASRALALGAFGRLAAAEARVHGVSPDDVHFHEVGAADAIVDICAAADGYVRLGVAGARTMPIATGTGSVPIAHGTYPIPAPASAYLLEGLPIRPGAADGELTTPTGAAFLAELCAIAPPPLGDQVVERVGYGAGARNPPDRPNCLRVWILRAAAPRTTAVEILQADVDDLSPEYIPALIEACLDAGALDATVHAIHMKKGRPAWRIECVLEPQWRESVHNAVFSHSSTLGLRGWGVERRTLFRTVEEREWRGHAIRIKRSVLPPDEARGAARVRAKPEFEDVAAAAAAEGMDPLQLMAMLRREWPELT